MKTTDITEQTLTKTDIATLAICRYITCHITDCYITGIDEESILLADDSGYPDYHPETREIFLKDIPDTYDEMMNYFKFYFNNL